MKTTVHNILEVKALIRETYAYGPDSDFYDGFTWYKHDGTYLCKSATGHTDFRLILADGSDLVVEVLQ